MRRLEALGVLGIIAGTGYAAAGIRLGLQHPTVTLAPGDTVMVIASPAATVVDTVTVTKVVVDTVVKTQTVVDTVKITDTVKVCDSTKTPPPPPPPPPPVGTPAPSSSSTVLLDMRQSLQRVDNIDDAFALFGLVDHTPYKSQDGIAGWSFGTNVDGNGLHAYRAEWGVSPADQGLRVIHYLPQDVPEFYAQWQTRTGKFAADSASVNGVPDSYAVWPQSNSCKRALFDRPDSQNRMDFTLSRNPLEVANIEMGAQNYSFYSDPSVWNINQMVGQPPYTVTVHVKAASDNTVADGVMQVWINGTIIADLNNMPASSELFDRWSFPETCVLVPQPQTEYFWDLLVWTP